MPFADYTRIASQQNALDSFPAVQAIDYQISQQTSLGQTAEETSRVAANEHYLSVRQLEADKQELLLDAALLAAQVYEHRAEAHRLAGEEGEAEVALARASVQRTNVDSLDLEMMNARVEVARQRRVVCAARGDEGGVKKAEREIKEAEEALDRAVVGQESLGEVEGEEVVEEVVEGGKSEEKR